MDLSIIRFDQLNFSKTKNSPVWLCAVPEIKLPTKTNNINKYNVIPVFNQGSESSCVDNAMVFLREAHSLLVKGKFWNLSRQFLYNMIRLEIYNDLTQDNGSSLQDAAVIIKQYGICLEELFPYGNLTAIPDDKAKQDAETFKLPNSYPHPTNYSIKQALAQGYAVAWGGDVFDTILDVKSNGIYHINTNNLNVIGKHAMAFLDYDDNFEIDEYIGAYFVRNSWSSEWGLNGYFWMPYANLNITNWEALSIN